MPLDWILLINRIFHFIILGGYNSESAVQFQIILIQLNEAKGLMLLLKIMTILLFFKVDYNRQCNILNFKCMFECYRIHSISNGCNAITFWRMAVLGTNFQHIRMSFTHTLESSVKSTSPMSRCFVDGTLVIFVALMYKLQIAKFIHCKRCLLIKSY